MWCFLNIRFSYKMAAGRLRLISGGKRMPVRVRRRRAGYKSKNLRKRIKGFTAQQSMAIRRAINRSDETKYIATQVADLNYAAAIGSATDCVSLVPKIPQGTDDWQRVGRKVTPVKSFVEVNLSFSPNFDGSALQLGEQIYAVLYVVTSKTWKNFNALPSAPGIFNNLLDNGDGTASPFTGALTDLAKPINRDEFRGLRKYVVKLTRNPGFQNNSTVAGGGLNANVPSMSARLRIPVKLPALHYDDYAGTSTGGYPTNTAPVMCIGWCYTDGSSTGLDTALLHVNARQHVWFKDA